MKNDPSSQQSVEYNPLEHRPPEKLKLGRFEVFVHLIKATLGTGELFMPYAFKRTGYVAALVCSVVIGIVATHTTLLVVTCSQIQCKRSRVPTLDYAETAETSFKNGPSVFQQYAKAIKLTTNIFLCFVQYQTIIIYTLYIATSFQQMFEFYTNINMDLQMYILGFLPIFYMLSLVPNLTYLVPLSLIGGLFLMVAMIITFYYFFEEMPPFTEMKMFTELKEVSVYCSVFLFAMHNIPVLMPLENSMREPHKMNGVLIFASLLSAFVVVAFGLFGYNKYNDTQDTVIKNLPFENGLAETVKVTVIASILLSYGLHYYIPVSILWPIISQGVGNTKVNETIFRIIGVTICTVTAAAVPQMAPLLCLFSAVTISTVMLLIPVLIETATKWEESDSRTRLFLAFKNVFLLLLWLMILCFGTLRSIDDLRIPNC